MNKKKLLVSVISAVTAVAFATGVAGADPAGAPTYRALVGVGSDTTQSIMNGLSDVVLDNGTKVIGSYDAVGSATITTKDPATNPACTIARPAGSGNGVNALVASLAAGDGCVQFARSSSNNSTSYAGKNLTYVPFAVDAVAYAIRSDSSISKKLTTANLTAIYNCTGGANYKPLLPHFGSGTRQFFLKKLGFTDVADFVTQPGHTCIAEVDSTNTPIEENVGTFLTDPKHIAPYSTAVYLAQINGAAPDVHGKTILGALDSKPAAVLNTGASFVRDVYNVLPDALVTDPLGAAVFVGANSKICTNTDTIKKFGFGIAANCGDTSIHTP